MVQAACESDDALLEKYLHGEAISKAEVKGALRKATVSGMLTPVICGTAFKNKGVQPLLDAVVDYLPSPLDVDAIEGDIPSDGKGQRKPSEDEQLAGLVFKIMTDPFVGQIAFVRIYSGVLESGSYVYNASILEMHANKREEVKTAGAGSICGVVGLKKARTGDTICDEKYPIILEAMSFPVPVIAVAIEPKTKADQEKLSTALGMLTHEDATFKVKVDQ